MIGRALCAVTIALTIALAAQGPATAADTSPAPTPVVTQQQRLDACVRRHRADYPARAACKVHVVWPGSRSTAREAVRVGWCESWLNPHAGIPRNTYWGIWQFDADARRTYRWGPSVVDQIRATRRIYRARGWQPFPNCKPGGRDHGPKWGRAPRSVRAYG